MTKYIFITGGVVSSLGKGIAAASLGLLLKSRGFRVVNQKFDPYLNIDPGTMNPFQHGEVFVTEDGAETDLDLGHYERFTDENLTQNSNTTAGRVFLSVLDREREGGYHGGTVQVIPNVTDEIRDRIMRPARETAPDIIITEIGGTVGDIESLPFIEAIRQTRNEVGTENCAFIHLTLMPYLKKAEELKSKPTQHSVKELQGLGIQPDIIMIRSERPIDFHIREKLALFCNVLSDAIIQNLDARSIYEVPLMMEKEGLGRIVCRVLSLPDVEPELSGWEEMVRRLYNPEKEVRIVLVGKYVELRDSYLSVIESLTHGGIANCALVNIDFVDSEELTDYEAVNARLSGCDGIIIPGGFGDRGVEGMILAVRYARENSIPYFGICLGMQIAVIEYARNVLALEGAHSTEMVQSPSHPVIDLMPDQNGLRLGGTLRLGRYACRAVPGSLIEKAYGTADISERHRHRYEFNNDYYDLFTKSALKPTGINPERNLVETVELEGHPWMVGVQFHPEFKSRPNRAHPLFRDFIAAAVIHATEAGAVK
ncbi:MAG: CTP synthase [Spirochaetaceae bacterium]|jgi:CTP synthase|nr:CTP synthase [Spirochaetaceae bacterium]